MPSALVDTHCHLNISAFAADLPAVLQRAQAANVSTIVVPAIDLAGCREALQLAKRNAGVYCALGMHPNSASEYDEAALRQIRGLAVDARVVAIGEIGLDYYWDKAPRQQQQSAFEAQLELAAELGLPVIVHNRDSTADVLAALEAWTATLPDGLRQRPGVMHSFSGEIGDAERALAAGFYLGFTGPITFKNAAETRAVAAATPLDRLLIETDAPYLAPQPRRGKRNEPALLPLVNAKLAEVHGVTPGQMARQTSHNARRLFALEAPNAEAKLAEAGPWTPN